MVDLNKYGTAADVNKYIAELEEKLAAFQQAMPEEAPPYVGLPLMVKKEYYDTLARAYAALKAKFDEDQRVCLKALEQIAELKAKLAARDQGEQA